MKYLKQFNNDSEYNSFKNSPEYVVPNVSLCVNNNEVHFNPIVVHEYVDLGLPSGTLWATENIKDKNGNELYFAWGDIQGYTANQIGTLKNFDETDYIFGPVNWDDYINNGMTKYTSIDHKSTLEAIDDAASVHWGTGWKMPTTQQFNELNDSFYTTKTWVSQNGINGALITSKSNGNTVFFPAVSSGAYGNININNNTGHYWSNNVCDNGFGEAFFFYFELMGSAVASQGDRTTNRYFGNTIRPVYVGS